MQNEFREEGVELKEKELGELGEEVIRVRRVFKVTKGGKTIGFNALVVVGNRSGKVGIGLGKGRDLLSAITKGRRIAQKNMIEVPLKGGTIPYEVEGKFKASRVLLKPASPGTGVIAGGGVRAILELLGVKDILTKSLGSNNTLNVAKATLEGLKKLKDPEEWLKLRKES